MKNYLLPTMLILILIFLVGCLPAQNSPVSNASMSTTAESSPSQKTDSTQTSTDTVESASNQTRENEPRQDGTRLDSAQLAYYSDLFSLKGNYPMDLNSNNYYNMALVQTFASPQELSLTVFFSLGFSNEWSNPITDAERSFYANTKGYDEFSLDMQRLPKELVAYVLDYYFSEEMDTGALVYNPDTQCYYLGSSGASAYPNISFTDGYFDAATGLISLYYTHFATGDESIMTIQSKASIGEAGYYIISNLPTA